MTDDTTSEQPAPNPTLKAIVAYIIEVENRDSERIEDAYAAIEAEGYRLVDAGQTGGYHPQTGLAPWAITDYRTGELLASGESAGPDGMDDAWQDSWYCVDAIEVEFEEIDYPAVPDRLFVAMRDEVALNLDTYRAWVSDQTKETAR